ncbi:MAG TPA: FAD-dependent oxidoreductase, partial [Actinomycetota bacterium]|nr:FAD-dependent oxidoreductase [Actinomycetota bacterium]
MAQDSFDVVVIGSGTGGYSAALRAAQLGLSVGLVERDERLGGTCLLRGCIPTKALLQSGAVMDEINRAEEWGIKASGEPQWDKVQAYKSKIVDKLVNGLTGLVKTRKIEVIRGEGKVTAPGKVDVGGRTITGKHVVV